MNWSNGRTTVSDFLRRAGNLGGIMNPVVTTLLVMFILAGIVMTMALFHLVMIGAI